MLSTPGKSFSVDALLAADKNFLARGTRAFQRLGDLVPARVQSALRAAAARGRGRPRVPGWRQRGVEALRQGPHCSTAFRLAAQPGGAVLTKQGGDALALATSEQTYAVTSDETRASRIRRKLAALRGTALASRACARADDLAETIARRYPYAPEAYSLIAGPRFDFDGRPRDPRREPTTPRQTR